MKHQTGPMYYQPHSAINEEDGFFLFLVSPTNRTATHGLHRSYTGSTCCLILIWQRFRICFIVHLLLVPIGWHCNRSTFGSHQFFGGEEFNMLQRIYSLINYLPLTSIIRFPSVYSLDVPIFTQFRFPSRGASFVVSVCVLRRGSYIGVSFPG